NPACSTRQLDDVETRVCTVGDVDIPPVVHFHVVALNGDLAAAVWGIGLANAPLVGLIGGRRNVVGDLFQIVWIAYIDDPQAGVEERDKQQAPVIDRGRILVRRVRPEAP